MFAQVLWYGLEHGAHYVMFAMGLTLCFGVMRVINMAQGELCMLGAMFVYALATFAGMAFFPAAAVSLVGVVIFGIIFNRVAVQPLIEKDPWSVIVATIGVSWILLYGGYALLGPHSYSPDFPFSQVLNLGGVRVAGGGITLVIATAIMVVALYSFLNKAGIGKVIRATSQNPTGARLVGISINRAYMYTMIVVSLLAGVTGIFCFPVFVLSPGVGQMMLITGFVVVIVGGLGNVTGCVIVGLLIGIIEALFGFYVDMLFRQPFIYSLMILALLVRPQGLFAAK